MYFISGAPLAYFGGIGAAAVLAFFALIKVAPYRMARLTVFLNPSTDPQGIGYHLNQALLAIGSGGLLGVGLGHSLQKFQYLPEVYADSLFAIIGEELGFVFCLLFMVGLIIFAVKGLRVAFRAPDAFGKFTAAGITSWIVAQSFVNIAAMLALIPITGLPLPFISYGGTAMMVTLAGSGILVNISRWA
jgi:cell division protein FtsW